LVEPFGFTAPEVEPDLPLLLLLSVVARERDGPLVEPMLNLLLFGFDNFIINVLT
jgi:hypothetical protein